MVDARPSLPKRGAVSGVGRLGTSGEAAGRFEPGDILAERYRIVGLLGKGGMGEVYRADDLKLGQPVAIKFLPPALAANTAVLARFHNEVRLARQITHRNICRVHDIGDLDGEHYLTMEMVDGENLASLLRRIGRLPSERAVQLARQLCAGLSAAHELGVLHRDLKPENVMIDGRGVARITDFGLAAVGEELPRGDIRSGTPAYMAPEQIAGRDVTVRSDLYALGLVLYEMFTGTPAFKPAGTMAELTQQRQSCVSTNPSQVVANIDPAVERVILRCLEPDPAQRPASALAVAAALPGGDPLAAALAAGETPSPEMVAAAGPREGLRPRVAWTLMGALVVGMLVSVELASRNDVLSLVPMDRSPEASLERVRTSLGTLGIQGKPADLAYGFAGDDEPLKWLKERIPDRSRWSDLQGGRYGVVTFWYRHSPRPLAPRNVGGIVTAMDPDPFAVSGGTRIWLDEAGHLALFDHVPPQVESPVQPVAAGTPVSAGEVDWKAIFDLAGLDMTRFAEVPSQWLPPVAADRRMAWEGKLPVATDVPIRVEAASQGGRPVYFEIVYPWSRPLRMAPAEATAPQRIAVNANIGALVIALASAAWLAWRNLKSGRGDRRGALRLGAGIVFSMVGTWALEANHQPSAQREWSSFVLGTSIALFVGGLVWALYIALEPAVRRNWPATLVSWTRLLAGRWRDPVVGRDLLVGVAMAALLAVAREGGQSLSAALGGDRVPVVQPLGALTGLRNFLAWPLEQMVSGLLLPMLLLLMLAGFRALLKKDRASILAAGALFAALIGVILVAEYPAWLAFVIGASLSAAYLFLLGRFGLLSMVATVFCGILTGSFPLTLDSSRWWFGYSVALLAIVFAIAAHGLHASLAGRSPAKEA